MFKWFRRGLLGTLAVVMMVTAGGYLWFWTSLPVTQGSIEIIGLTAPLRIVRDAYGIPTIQAKSEADAYFALGFVHAQDRLWQMDFNRRVGSGRLSEILGKRALGIDHYMRAMGIARLAEMQLPLLAPATRATLKSYSAGVNAHLATHRGAWPPEFTVLRYKPEPWKPSDSLIWSRMMALRLAYNQRTESLRARLATRLSPTQIAQMWPEHGATHPVTLAGDLTRPDIESAAAVIGHSLAALDPITASNGWVVAGNRSRTGKPLLANDPHLPFRAPVLWYLARVEAPGLRLTGATVPGVPFTLLGHNEHIAWGFTAAGGDTQDLFVERRDPADPERYQAPGGSRRFAVRNETIRVRGDEDVAIRLLATRHGPVISAPGKQSASVTALATPALDPTDHSPDAFHALNHAAGWNDFRAAMEKLWAPHLNVFYADVRNNIGFISTGKIPLRKQGDGRTPVPGWNGDHDWSGFIPFDNLPQALNPPIGWIANANNRIAPSDYPYRLGRARAPGYRAQRIGEMLSALPIAGPDDIAGMQLDAVSLMARDLLPLMLQAKIDVGDERARLITGMLRRWDGTMARGKPEPLIFTAWLRTLNRQLYADELGSDFSAFRGLRPQFVKAILTSYRGWCDDVTTASREDCSQRIALARDISLKNLAARFGDDPAEWRWGKVHKAVFSHPLLGRIALLRRLADLSIEAGGGAYTLNRGRSHVGDPKRPFAAVHGAGLRTIYDMSHLALSRFMIATGQSGNPVSDRYRNLIGLWRDGAYISIGATDKNMAGGQSVLILRPKGL